MPEHLEQIVAALLAEGYADVRADAAYHSGFADEGDRKAQYIIDDLLERQNEGQLRTSEIGYLSIGGSDGSELISVMKSTGIRYGVLLEIGDEAVRKASGRQQEIVAEGYHFRIVHGDAATRLDDSLIILEEWRRAGAITGLACSAQAVLHELPYRSGKYDTARFLGRLFREPSWKACLFYSREPSRPAGWPDQVRIRTPFLQNDSLVRAAMFIRDRLKMDGDAVALSSNWTDMPAQLAVETLHKLLRGNSIRRIGYELGEQLTAFDALAVKRLLENMLDGMKVSVEQITTSGFKKSLQTYEVEYVGANSESLPVPRTHCEIKGALVRESIKASDIGQFSAPQPAPPIVPISNPFGGDVPDSDIVLWLSQFEEQDRPWVAKLLQQFRYVDLATARRLTAELQGRLRVLLGSEYDRAVFVPMGGAAKSGGLVAYMYRVQNQLPSDRFLHLETIDDLMDPTSPVILLDDILATGHQAVAESVNLCLASQPRRRIVLATLLARSAGARFVTEHSSLETCAAVDLTSADELFSPSSTLFPTDTERTEIHRILLKYGTRIAPNAPLGYAASGLLVAFEHSTPDNTFPIFWAETASWHPLLRRGGSSRLGPLTGP